jgi:hypothetical protein
MRRLLIFVTLLCASPALAGNDSAYSDLDLSKCTQLTPETSGEEGESSGILECKGYKGFPVTFAEGDLRSFVAFGKSGQDHCAFRQTFGGFNSTGEKVEWRLKDGTPIATILRWKVSYDSVDATKLKSWLVVTKLEDNQSCHMAYIEGGYPNANEKARELADSQASSFSCKNSNTIFIANPGTETSGIASDGGCEK